MRNYVCLSYARIDWVPPPAGQPSSQAIFAPDPETRALVVNAYLGAPPTAIAQVGIPGTITGVISEVGAVYIELDKSNICDHLVQTSLHQIPNFIQKMDDAGNWSDEVKGPSANTPRAGWSDDAGVDRKPTPSDRGKAHLGAQKARATLIAYLLNTYVALKRAGNVAAAVALRRYIIQVFGVDPEQALK